ncbi:MAG: adenylate/guanylate cyclase domain-containing protein [Helicobacteraceae bacterium]|nr:adenylate/guanylate cyclase domain-containing protein [Helicobacteraceae bacterium]
MIKSIKSRAKLAAALSIAAVSFAVCVLATATGVFDFLEYKTYDLRANLFASSFKPSDDIIVALLDQASIDWANKERGWSWPWPRKAYAQIVDYMNVGGAKAIAFDVLFSEPSAYGKEDDAAFAASSERFGGVVQAVFFGGGTLGEPLLGEFSVVERVSADRLAFSAQLPIETLRSAARAVGSVTGKPDSDGVFRRYKLFEPLDGEALPSLGAAILIAAGFEEKTVVSDGRFIKWGDYEIPIDENAKALLRFKGDLSRYVPYSAADILQSLEAYSKGEEPLLPPEDFEGKYIAFGFYAPGLYDIFASPISSVYPGAGMHITMLDNMLSGDFIAEFPLWANILICFLSIGSIAFLTLYANRVYLSVAALFAVESALVGLSALFYVKGFWMIVVAPTAGTFAAFVAAALCKYAAERGQKRFIKSAFGQYLSPVVIDALLTDPSKLKLGGEEREMTAIFTDIRGFSTVSEALESPSKLVELLNYYLTVMSDIILDYQGAIDKYEGDAIIGFFGAPIYTPNHAALACKAAIAMKKAELSVNREAIKNGLITQKAIDALIKKYAAPIQTPVYTRIGVNSGDMVVGNMGTQKKMNYTIMGNAVNLAARLEGANKRYDTGGILIGERTKELAGDEFIYRRLSKIRAVGVQTPLRLYELIDLKQNASPLLKETIAQWNIAFDRYENREFAKAFEIFSAIYGENNRDLTAKRYADICDAYAQKAPSAEEWDDGIDNLSEK